MPTGRKCAEQVSGEVFAAAAEHTELGVHDEDFHRCATIGREASARREGSPITPECLNEGGGHRSLAVNIGNVPHGPRGNVVPTLG